MRRGERFLSSITRPRGHSPDSKETNFSPERSLRKTKFYRKEEK
jgi:hypothetical protein